jgi:luciferase family oxidoreductase group 1
MQLAVLDLCAAPDGTSEGIAATIEVAELADRLGFTRYWITEHHSTNAWHSSPEVVLPVLAGLTETIRVGAAGVLLRYRSAFKLVEDFSAIAALYPGRVDLGLARGCAPATTDARFGRDLRLDRSYEDKAADVLELLAGKCDVPFSPCLETSPQVWFLGSGTRAASIASSTGMRLCLSLFLRDPHPPAKLCDIVKTYRSEFKPSRGLSEPYCAVAIAGVLSSTREFEDHNPAFVANIVGPQSVWMSSLQELRATTNCDELVVMDLASDRHQRRDLVHALADCVKDSLGSGND